jgi:GNAT superfamily N-acetyltransferase
VAATEEAVPVSMTLASLDRVPDHPLPPGFSLRMFRPGDEQTWTDIWVKAEKYLKITTATFTAEFGSDAPLLAQRQFFLLDGGGQPVGTATAWLTDKGYAPDAARVHWVAIVPEMQGRGLSRPLLSAVLKRMKELGYRSSFLGTHSARTAAVKLYLEFGFVPEVRNERERQGWRAVRQRIAPSVLDRLIE